MTTTRTPRHNRCDFCGHNAHKVAVRYPSDGRVEGFCPSCWNDDDPFMPRQQAAKAGGTVVYDRRQRATP